MGLGLGLVSAESEEDGNSAAETMAWARRERARRMVAAETHVAHFWGPRLVLGLILAFLLLPHPALPGPFIEGGEEEEEGHRAERREGWREGARRSAFKQAAAAAVLAPPIPIPAPAPAPASARPRQASRPPPDAAEKR